MEREIGAGRPVSSLSTWSCETCHTTNPIGAERCANPHCRQIRPPGLPGAAEWIGVAPCTKPECNLCRDRTGRLAEFTTSYREPTDFLKQFDGHARKIAAEDLGFAILGGLRMLRTIGWMLGSLAGINIFLQILFWSLNLPTATLYDPVFLITTTIMVAGAMVGFMSVEPKVILAVSPIVPVVLMAREIASGLSVPIVLASTLPFWIWSTLQMTEWKRTATFAAAYGPTRWFASEAIYLSPRLARRRRKP